MKKEKKQRPKLCLKEIWEKKKILFLYAILRIMVVLIMLKQFFNGNYENVFLCILTLILFLIPAFVEKKLKIDIPDVLESIVLLFIFAAEILGEIRQYHITYPYWDTMLHTMNGFLAAAIGFSMVEILNRNDKIVFKLSPAFLAVVAFCFSMTIGVLWEFFECGMDILGGFDMQKDTVLHAINSVMLDPTGGNTPTGIKGITEVMVNGQELGLGGYLDIGLLDTMKDLFVNFIGAVVFSIIGFFYVKHRGKGKILPNLILKSKKENFISENSISFGGGHSWNGQYDCKVSNGALKLFAAMSLGRNNEPMEAEDVVKDIWVNYIQIYLNR